MQILDFNYLYIYIYKGWLDVRSFLKLEKIGWKCFNDINIII